MPRLTWTLATLALAAAFAAPAGAAPLFARVSAPRAGAGATQATVGGTRFRLDAGAIVAFRAAGGGPLTVPAEDGDLHLTLAAFDVLDGGTITYTDDSGTHAFDPQVTLFRGTVEGDADGWAVIAMSPEGVTGTIWSGGRRRVFGVAGAARPGEIAPHVLVEDPDDAAEAAGWSCGVEGEAAERALRDPAKAFEPLLSAPAPGTALSSDRLTFKIAIDCDYEIYANKFGGDLTAATSYMLTVLGQVSLIYQRDIACTLTYPYLNFWTTAADPYTGATTSQQLPQFRSYWLANRGSVVRSLAHLVSGRSLGGGIAYLDALCGTFGYGVSQVDAVYGYPTNSTTWDVEVLAHELGHNFGSPHTQSCTWQSSGFVPPGATLDSCYASEEGCNSVVTHVPPDKGTIMSYCHLLAGGINNIRLDFHSACRTKMRTSAEAASCQALVALQPPRQLIATPSATGIDLSWTAGTTTGVLGYDVYRSAYQLDPTTTVLRSTPGLSVADTAFGTYYYRVRSIRAADSSEFSGELKVSVCPLQAPVAFPAGGGPSALARGDFNQDGIEDLAIADALDDGVSVLLGLGTSGQGDGEFATAVFYATGATATCVAAGDWNGDGILDLAVGNHDANTVRILNGEGSAGVGTGTFAPAFTVPGVSRPADIASGDFDEDGIQDLVVTSDLVSATILRGNGTDGVGDGTFAVDSIYSGGVEPHAVRVADLNQDGIQDFVIAHSGGARVFLGEGSDGHGDGTFAPGVDYTCGFVPSSITAADFNGDGVLDLALANSGASDVSVLAGAGDGTFGAASAYPSGATPFGIQTADWSGDGVPDLLVANSTSAGTLSILVGNGAGGPGSFGPPTAVPVTAQPRNTLLGDFNEDGAPDIAVVNRVAGTLNIVRASCTTSLPVAIEVTSPNGGEVWIGNQERSIAWTKGPGVLAVDVQVSRDAGAHWQTIAHDVIGTSLAWTVTPPFTSEARVRVVDAVIHNRQDASNASFTVAPQSSVDVGGPSAVAFALTRAWPNPAHRALSVSFALPDRAPAMLELLDLAGRRVASQSVGHLGPGVHRVTLAPDRTLAQGLYWLRLSHRNETRSVKVAFLD